MPLISPLRFNIAMKTMMSHQLYELDDNELDSMAQKGSASNSEGLDAARVLEAAVSPLSDKPDTPMVDLVGGWLYAAMAYAMFGDLVGAQTAISELPTEALASAPTYGMTACICSPLHTPAIVAADLRVAEFGRLWQQSLSADSYAERKFALESALTILIDSGLAGCTMECSLVMSARTAAWQVHRAMTGARKP